MRGVSDGQEVRATGRVGLVVPFGMEWGRDAKKTSLWSRLPRFSQFSVSSSPRLHATLCEMRRWGWKSCLRLPAGGPECRRTKDRSPRERSRPWRLRPRILPKWTVHVRQYSCRRLGTASACPVRRMRMSRRQSFQPVGNRPDICFSAYRRYRPAPRRLRRPTSGSRRTSCRP